MSDLNWYMAHRGAFLGLVEILAPLWTEDGVTMEEGVSAYSNVVPPKTDIAAFASGGGANTGHLSTQDDGAESWRTNALITVRVPYAKEKKAMRAASLVLNNLSLLAENNMDTLYLTGHPDITPEWVELANADNQSLHFRVTIPFEMVYSVYTTPTP